MNASIIEHFSQTEGPADRAAQQECFMNWVMTVHQVTDGQVVAMDGKGVRRSFDRGARRGAIHLISAWGSATGVVLGQLKTDAKSNEITAIAHLLGLLELKGCIVTLDAMGCQTEIGEKIVEKSADYVRAVKGNQGQLDEAIVNFFDTAQRLLFKVSPLIILAALFVYREKHKGKRRKPGYR